MTKALHEVASRAQDLADLNGGAVGFNAGLYVNGFLTHLRATVFPRSALNRGFVQLEPWHQPPFNPQPPSVKIEDLENDSRLLTEKEYDQRFTNAVNRQLDPVQLRAALRSQVSS